MTFAVTWQFSNYNKNTLGHELNAYKTTKRTCRTVTGTLTPLSSYMLVIPRLRAIRPVRTELGVHFGAASVVAVASFATVELKCLKLADGDRFHSRNIEEVLEARKECELSDPAQTSFATHPHVRACIH